jgi:myo-inositol-1(or 4)-monophosphatase
MQDVEFLISGGVAALAAASQRLDGRAGRVSIKQDGSLLTDLDLAVEEIIIDSLTSLAPDLPVLSEERQPVGSVDPSRFTGWVLDPIDGTTNLAGGQALYCISLGLLCEGSPVGGMIWDSNSRTVTSMVSPVDKPARELSDAYIGLDYEGPPEAMAWGIRQFSSLAPRCRSVRVLGSVALGMLWVAKGVLDIYLAPRPRIWDYAGGWYLVEGAGRVVKFVDRGMDNPSLICGESRLVEQWLDRASESG